ncbi:MAG: HU family DNA-binding protein [Thermodesulfobacteriota bacterium]
MTKGELVSHVAQNAQVTKKAAEMAVDAIIKAIHTSLTKEGEIRIDQLGTFVVTERKARTGVNPRTGDKIQIPACRVPAFRAAKALKEAAKGGAQPAPPPAKAPAKPEKKEEKPKKKK